MSVLTATELEVSSLGPLTRREAECLLWIAEGKTAWEAGAILGISEATANAHIARASAKLNASNRPHLVARAFVAGILSRALCGILAAAVLLQVATSGLGDARVASRPIRRRRDEIVLQRWA